MVIVVAEGAGQDLIAQDMRSMDIHDASGNKLFLDVGLWLSQKIKVWFYFFLQIMYLLSSRRFKYYGFRTQLFVVFSQMGLYFSIYKRPV